MVSDDSKDRWIRRCVGLLVVIFVSILLGCTKGLSPELSKDLDEAVLFVESYKSNRNRLPERDEFHQWLWTNNGSAVADYGLVDSPGAIGDYQIHLWRGEWMAIYSSKDRKLRDQR